MKQIIEHRCESRVRGLLLLSAVCALLGGCGVGGQQQTARDETRQELEKVQQENRELPKLRAENRELPRLRKDNQEIQNLRTNAQELARARQENELLKKQVAEASQQRGNRTLAANPQSPGPLASPTQSGGLAATGTPGSPAEAPVADPNLPQEGDQILIEPRLLAKLLPDFDWSKIERKDPVVVNNILEQQGIVLTNYQQLIGLGVTNYIVQRGAQKIKPPTEK